MIVTIDGPAGAGKTTVAKALASRLGFRFLDTGAMYRVVALAGTRAKICWDKPEEVARLARELKIEFDGQRVLLNGQDVTREIRSNELIQAIRHTADNRAVRLHLVRLQQEFGQHADLVTEGRDQGTLVFPEAECKFFLTASPEERARRRVEELLKRGETVTVEEVLAQQNRRDDEDQGRDLGALTKAKDAIEVCTDGLSLEQVVDRLEQKVLERRDESVRR